MTFWADHANGLESSSCPWYHCELSTCLSIRIIGAKLGLKCCSSRLLPKWRNISKAWNEPMIVSSLGEFVIHYNLHVCRTLNPFDEWNTFFEHLQSKMIDPCLVRGILWVRKNNDILSSLFCFMLSRLFWWLLCQCSVGCQNN